MSRETFETFIILIIKNYTGKIKAVIKKNKYASLHIYRNTVKKYHITKTVIEDYII